MMTLSGLKIAAAFTAARVSPTGRRAEGVRHREVPSRPTRPADGKSGGARVSGDFHAGKPGCQGWHLSPWPVHRFRNLHKRNHLQVNGTFAIAAYSPGTRHCRKNSATGMTTNYNRRPSLHLKAHWVEYDDAVGCSVHFASLLLC